MRKLLPLCTVLIATSAAGQPSLSQQQLAERIYDLSHGEDISSFIDDPRFRAYSTSAVSYLQVEACTAHFQSFVKVSEDRYSIRSESHFDLTGTYLHKGHDISESFVGSETENDYTYTKIWSELEGGTIYANVVIGRYDEREIPFSMRDFSSLRDTPDIDADQLPMTAYPRPFAIIVVINPKDEDQLRNLAAAINEYRDRFCLVGS